MNCHVINAKYIKDYIISIMFESGETIEFDFKNEFDGPIYEPLKNKEYFKSFTVHGNTICWENGADFAPEYLYEKVKSKKVEA